MDVEEDDEDDEDDDEDDEEDEDVEDEDEEDNVKEEECTDEPNGQVVNVVPDATVDDEALVVVEGVVGVMLLPGLNG